MKTNNLFLVLAAFFIAGITSCAKKELQSEKTNYGKVQLSLVELPNTPAIDVFFQEEKKLDIQSGGSNFGEFISIANKKGKLAVYKAGTTEVVADTLISIPANNVISLRVACSDDLGIKTFMGASKVVSPDSCTFQLFNNLPDDIMPPGVNVDVHIFLAEGLNIIETGIVLPDFPKKKLHPTSLTLPVAYPNGNSYSYAFKFKNKETGAFLLDKKGKDFTATSLPGGKSLIMSVIGRVSLGKLGFGLTTAAL